MKHNLSPEVTEVGDSSAAATVVQFTTYTYVTDTDHYRTINTFIPQLLITIFRNIISNVNTIMSQF